MKKIAFFVEGSTEAIFIEWLIKKAAPRTARVIIEQQLMKGKKGQRILLPIKIFDETNVATHYIQIVNSCNDDMVKSDIIEQVPSLLLSGFSEIYGLRDLYPNSFSELPLVERYLNTGLPGNITINIHLAVMEIEAWFIAESSHFSRISRRIDRAKISKKEGIDICNCDVERIPHPADTLHRIYQIGFKQYKKKHNQVFRTVNAFDYNYFKNSVAEKIPRLKSFLESVSTTLN